MKVSMYIFLVIGLINLIMCAIEFSYSLTQDGLINLVVGLACLFGSLYFKNKHKEEQEKEQAERDKQAGQEQDIANEGK